MKKQSKHSQSLPVINPNAAGIDIGASFHVVAIAPDKAMNQLKHSKHLLLIYMKWQLGYVA